MNTKKLTKAAAVASIYVAMTMLLPMLGYGPIQFRISEILTLLAFYNPIYVPAITVGVAISNLASPLGMIDVIFGSLHSLISLWCMSRTKNIWHASLYPALFSFIIGAEIVLFSPEPLSFIAVSLQIMTSELIIVTLIGVPVFKILERHPIFRDIVLNPDYH